MDKEQGSQVGEVTQPTANKGVHPSPEDLP